MNPTLGALTGFVSWTLLLLVLMEGIRTKLVATKAVAANGFTPDNATLSPFMQRLARAHANCLEGLPVFGGLMLISLLAGKPSLTDPLAYVLLAARVIQSLIHLWSTSPAAVTLRFGAFAVQMAIGLYWAARLLLGVMAQR
ncbi:MAG: MAPEG family protein [Ramlibacter sp.]